MTGSTLLDEILGGVPPGLPVVLCGPSGSGRTVFCLQQVHAALRQGEVAAILTAEPARLLLQQAESMGFSIQQALREHRLHLLELAHDSPQTTRVHGGRALATAILEAAPSARLVVVDPITILTSELLDESEMRGLIRELFESLSRAGCAALATAEQERIEEDSALARALKDSCGAFAELGFAEDGGHLLRVARSRISECSEAIVRFRVGSGGVHREPGPGIDPGPSSPDGQRCVLIVEDEPVTREMMRDWLAPSYRIDVAEDGFSAVSAILRHHPDLVLLDLHLPRASGYEVLRVLRGAGVNLPVLVVSGRLARASDRFRALVLGATDLMPKPLQSFELLHKVDKLLRYASDPDLDVHAQDAEDLLGKESTRRQLNDRAFRERLALASRLGEQFNLQSTLLPVEACTSDAIDALVGLSEERLRPEDALLQVGKTHALLLLTACRPADAQRVLKRLARSLAERGATHRNLRCRAYEARSRSDTQNWDDLFQALERWPAPSQV